MKDIVSVSGKCWRVEAKGVVASETLGHMTMVTCSDASTSSVIRKRSLG